MKYNVMSLMKTDVKYHTNGKCVVIKAETTRAVDSDIVKPEKIIACYGSRVRIIENWDNFDTDLEVVAETKDETKEPVKDEVKDETKDEVKEPVKDEVKDETKDEVKDEVKEPVKDEVKKPKTQGNKAGNSKNKTDKK